MFPHLPPPQNGMPESEFNPGTMFTAGSQNATDVGADGNGTTPTDTSNSNNVSVCARVHLYINTLPDN